MLDSDEFFKVKQIRKEKKTMGRSGSVVEKVLH